jgi:hypothetical protein
LRISGEGTGIRSSSAQVKEMGMNRLEISQYLQNGPLGKVNSLNLKILKCPGNPDSIVALKIAILE